MNIGFEIDINPELIDLLIKKKQEEDKKYEYEAPQLRLPLPAPPSCWDLEELKEKTEKKDEDCVDGAIIIDL